VVLLAANANATKVQARVETPIWSDMSIPFFLHRRGTASGGQAISTYLELLLFSVYNSY
jgi:hypothetical protein